MSDKKKSLRLVWELLTVALGVFLALVVNNLSEQSKENRLVTKVIAGLKQEIEQNKTMVQRSLTFHSEFLEKLRNDEEGLILQLNTAPIISSAWDAAKSSEVMHLMDYDLSLAFAEIYSWHEEYNKLRFLSDQALYMVRFSNSRLSGGYLKRWSGGFEDFKYTEEQLIARYEKALSMIDGI